MCFLGPSCKWLCKCSSFRASLFWACWNIIFGLVLIDQVLDFVRAQKLATVIKVIGCVSGAGFTLSGAMLLAGILKGSRCLVCASIVVCGLSTLVIHWLIVPLGKKLQCSVNKYCVYVSENGNEYGQRILRGLGSNGINRGTDKVNYLYLYLNLIVTINLGSF
ncbi:uncharacterized protein LOC111072696 isoform X1 [Drosophila obscura]|uniref:uncharacterized protein LOC111072696 isoform X1 n=1 Tax=Drosophila obscura TaxID=7282 RepID=UPI001BB197A1|nr:uncharacterized protein LOC111072696 isoform X1 [Drosophila obscura]